jgi:3-hydroxyacyl-CoA dehydrogenase
METIGVLGAGVMGSGIAQVLAAAGCETHCVDRDPDALSRAEAGVGTGPFGLERQVERGRMSREDADAALARLHYSTDVEALTECDLVLETVTEMFDLKIQVFRQLDRVARPDAILATNTSGFSIAAIGAATDRPQQVIGWHWSSPPPVMRLAEITRSPATSDATVAAVSELAMRCGKRPIVINDAWNSWGFVTNRALTALRKETDRIVAEGIATEEQIDLLLMDCFNWPSGPYGVRRGATSGWDTGAAEAASD